MSEGSGQALEDEDDELRMTVDMNVIEHLGLNMYTSLPAVISEYVANAWDAGATEVHVRVPRDEEMNEDYEITILDNGIGMDIDDINNKFLVVGRNRRDDDDEDGDEITVNGMRRQVLGRKGIGKLAGFGVAGLVEVKTIQNHEAIKFEMDYEKIKEQTSTEDPKTEYKPEILERRENADVEHGTKVILTDLERQKLPAMRYIKRRLGRRFGLRSENFDVYVNGEKIDIDDGNLKEDCEHTWEFDDEPIDDEGEYTIDGWIGTMEDPVDNDDIGNGVVVMTRGKLVQEPTDFGLRGKGVTGQTALSYLVGIIHADFLDEKDDLISTARKSVIWGREPAASLRNWIQDELRTVCSEWVDLRRDEKLKDVREQPVYEERIASLPDSRKKIIDKLLSQIADKEGTDEEVMRETADFLASGVEHQEFRELVKELDEADISDPDKLIDIFKEWEVIDALDTLRVAEGRFEVIMRFKDLIEAESDDLPEAHEFLADNPWLIEPRWDYVDTLPEYREMLKEEFGHQNATNRIDFLSLAYGNSINIIDLREPGSTLTRQDLTRLEDYVDYVRDEAGEGEEERSGVNGYLIGGEVTEKAEMKIDRLSRDNMYVRTYDRMKELAQEANEEFIDIFKEKAERTGDYRLKERISELEQVHAD